ncbi:MAG: SWIM zinc finger family protein [Halobacteria archaeon]
MEWIEELRDRRSLDADITRKILERHGERGKRGIDAVSEQRVKKYMDFVVVVGRHDEYVIEDDSCTCEDFRYNLGGEGLCWHVIAKKIAFATDSVDEHDMWYSEVRDFL